MAEKSQLDNTSIQLVYGDVEALEDMSEYLKQNSEYDVEIVNYKSILRI